MKSTSIDPSVVGEDGVYRKRGPARIFLTEHDTIEAIKKNTVREGDVIVLICRGPLGSGMEETYQITSALKHLPFGKHVAVITDARFSGVSTGACIGHVSPEALAGGPVGKLRDGDLIEIVVDRNKLEGHMNFIGENGEEFRSRRGASPASPSLAAARLASRSRHFPMTLASGPPCSRQAVESGAAASSMSSRLSAS